MTKLIKKLLRVAVTVLILALPLETTANCAPSSGDSGDSNPDSGRSSGGGDRPKVQNSTISTVAITVYYGEDSQDLEPGDISDFGKAATKFCLPKGAAGDYQVGRGEKRTIKSGACVSTKKNGNDIASVVAK